MMMLVEQITQHRRRYDMIKILLNIKECVYLHTFASALIYAQVTVIITDLYASKHGP